jgi:hypothetical protein
MTKVVSSNTAHGEVYSIQQYVRKFVSDLRQVGGFLHQQNWPPRYSWNIVESGVKHHNPLSPYSWMQMSDDLSRAFITIVT